ncbi:DUF3267 domain-containing protein [Arcicella lustrica]|uniref:DUF3267 domain-containing protein n=1 Tax=Arcicella lustrica TaxID=2984196 RepID=A0ABU5SFM6_9BACT|nr:DUF3267 domain-containing protein [Arcicella sp. DC25W]MEA5426066.1 DUF3267 domain-containing protein [Arcicella sp. DC25W]
MKKPSIDELHNPNHFSLVESFKIDEMMTFLMKELGANSTKPKTGNKIMRIVLIGMVGAVVGYFIGKQIGKFKLDSWQFLEAFGLLIFVLLPIHEGIHGFVFKILGAEKVGFGWTPKTLMVYAYAQKFVMSLKENAIVAVMPFLVITLALLVAFFAVPEYKTLVVSTFILHTYGCLGDFILIKYYFKYRHKQMFTYDDIDEAGMTYFFEKD